MAPLGSATSFSRSKRKAIASTISSSVTVTDDEIVDAMIFLFDRLKLVVEPSGAVGIAALLSGKLEARGAQVGVVISGGNVGAARFAELVATSPAGRSA